MLKKRVELSPKSLNINVSAEHSPVLLIFRLLTKTNIEWRLDNYTVSSRTIPDKARA